MKPSSSSKQIVDACLMILKARPQGDSFAAPLFGAMAGVYDQTGDPDALEMCKELARISNQPLWFHCLPESPEKTSLIKAIQTQYESRYACDEA
ncbi:MAG: hypothetical protein LBS49_05235 [Candidatus Accumulibacter sp.]|jgi:hypothetical protein|nr:hypothetical protein [Accumulibacter sp.]